MALDKGTRGKDAIRRKPPPKKTVMQKPDAIRFGADVGLFTPPALIPPPAPLNPDLNKVPGAKPKFKVPQTAQDARKTREAKQAAKDAERTALALLAPVSTAARVKVRQGETAAEKKARTGTQPGPKKTKGWAAREKSLWGNVLQGLGDAGEGLVRAGAEGLLSAAWDAEESGSRVPAGAAGALAGATAATDVLAGTTIGKDLARMAAGAAFDPTGAKIDVALLPFLAIGRPFKGLKAARAAAKAARAGKPLDEIADVAEEVYRGGQAVAAAAPSSPYLAKSSGSDPRVFRSVEEARRTLDSVDNLLGNTGEPTPGRYFHVAPKTQRANIESEGLQDKLTGQGVFVWDNPEDAREYQRLVGGDMWEVDPNGLTFEPDAWWDEPGRRNRWAGPGQSFVTREPISPDALRPLESTPAKLPKDAVEELRRNKEAAEKYLAAHTLDPAVADARLDELAGFLEPFIDDAYTALRQTDPSSTIGADKRVRRQMTDADRFKTHAIGVGDPVDLSDAPLIRPQIGPEVDRDRAERIIYEAAKRSDSPVANQIVEAFDEIEAINGALTHRAETDFLAALDPYASAQADEAQAWLDGLAIETQQAAPLAAVPGGPPQPPSPPRPTAAAASDPGDPGYRARTLKLGEHEQQLVRARSRITQQGERLVDQISKSLDPTWVGKTPGLRVMTVGARVPKHAGRIERHLIVRRPAKVGTAIKTLHKVEEGSFIDAAHFWYAQLPEAYRNAEGLKLVRQAQVEELNALTNGESLAKLNERKQMLQVLQLDAETKGQAMRLQSQINDVDSLITDLPRRRTDVAASIRSMQDLILHAPENDDAIIQSLREVMEQRKKTLVSEGRLEPERAAGRESLVASWLGLEPDGTEIYMGHRLPPDTLSRSRVQQVSAGTGRVASPRGVGSRNRLVLATTGRVRPSVHVALEDYAASQVFETAMNARKFLSSIGKPFDFERGYQKGFTLINPKAKTVPPHLRTEELVQFTHTGEDMDEIRGMAQDIVDSFMAKNKKGNPGDYSTTKGDWERFIEEAAENGVKADELMLVPDYQVERYYKQFRSFSGQSRPGVGYDMGVDFFATSIVFARLGYIPKNIVQNIIMAVPHQGVWLPINAVRSAQIMLHPKFRELRNMARAEIGSSGAARALAGESAKRGPTKKMLNAVASFVGSIADDPARLSAFLHEAMAEGVVGKANPFLSKKEADRLIDLLTNPKHERKLNDIMHRSTEAMADFTRLTPDQARMARRFLIIPGWLMAGSRYPFHFAATHPVRSALMAYIAMGEPGAPDGLQFNDRIDTYFNGRDYLQGIDTPWGRLRTGSLNPVTTPWDLARSVAGSVRGKEGPFDYETPTAFDWANPLAAEAIDFLRGESSLGRSAKRLFPGLTYLKDQVSPVDDPRHYPEDTSRLGRFKRELGIVPIEIDDELDEDTYSPPEKPGRGRSRSSRKPGSRSGGMSKPGS